MRYAKNAQVTVFALYKVCRALPDAEANLRQLLTSGGLQRLCAVLRPGGSAEADPTARDMAHSLLLDLALLAETPEYCAEHDVVAHLAQVRPVGECG